MDFSNRKMNEEVMDKVKCEYGIRLKELRWYVFRKIVNSFY